jgi:hypothetical protein
MASNAKASKQLKPGLLPKWLFPPRFSDKNRFISSREDLLPSPRKQKSNRIAMKGGGFLGGAGGN